MHRNTVPSIWLAAAAAVWVAGCTPKNEFVEPPPPEVTVQPPLRQTVTVFIGFPGRVQSKESADIRARVSGYLRSVDFVDGQIVKSNQQLFVIEPEPFQAALTAARANLDQAKANRSIATTERDRRAIARETEAISQIDLERAEADLKAAEAVELGAEAAVAQAVLDLSYTTNYAPFSGRINRKRVSVGNLVGGTDATLLTTLVAEDPIYVYVNVSERRLMPFLRRSGRDDISKEAPPVQVELADMERYQREGRIDYMDNAADPETGTVTVRAIFDNPDGQLIPGLYGKILLPDVRTNAMIVPDLSIQRDIGGAYVLVVDGEGTVSSKYVVLGPKVDEGRIIEEGLDGSEQVIVNGIQRARPGIKVTATTAAIPKAVPSEVIEDQ